MGPYYHYSYGAKTNTLVITDNAIVTNANRVAYAYSSNGNVLTIEKGAKIYANSSYVSQGTLFNCRFSLLSGAEYHAYAENPALLTAGDNNVLTFDGSDTLFVAHLNYPYFCHSGVCRNNRLTISNDAKLMATGFYYLQRDDAAYSCSNVVSIKDGAKLESRSGIYFATASYITNNYFEILNGATVDVQGVFYLGGNENVGTTLIVSNSTLNCTRVYHNGRVSYDTRLRLMGSDAHYNLTYTSTLPLFGSGTGCVFSVEQGATWTYYEGKVCFGYTSDHGSFNRVDILEGSKIKVKEFDIGASAANMAVTNCVLYVGDGSVLETQERLAVYCANNNLVVSNGTVNVGTTLLWAGATDNYVSENNTIVLQGNKPKINVPNGKLEFRNGSTLRIELPETGYENDAPLIEASALLVAGNAGSLVFDGLEKFQKKCETKTSVTLLRLNGTNEEGKRNELPYYYKTVYLKEASDALPEGCSLSVDAYSITLVVSPVYKRTVIFIK